MGVGRVYRVSSPFFIFFLKRWTNAFSAPNRSFFGEFPLEVAICHKYQAIDIDVKHLWKVKEILKTWPVLERKWGLSLGTPGVEE